MTRSSSDNIGTVLVTLLVAYILTAVPLPEWGSALRPAWVPLVLIYWVIAMPHRIGVVSGWFAGLFLDGLTGSALGQHALALAVVAYIAYVLHMRIRVFPMWQQCLTMLVLVGTYQLINILIIRAVHITPWTLWYWTSVLISALVWPWVTIGIDLVNRRHRPN